MKKPLLVKEIVITDSYHFRIVWNDEVVSLVKLSDLQRVCPCVKCHGKNKNRERVEGEDQLTAKRLVNVGRFGLKIEFSKGCSSGIYPFSLVRMVSKE